MTAVAPITLKLNAYLGGGQSKVSAGQRAPSRVGALQVFVTAANRTFAAAASLRAASVERRSGVRYRFCSDQVATDMSPPDDVSKRSTACLARPYPDRSRSVWSHQVSATARLGPHRQRGGTRRRLFRTPGERRKASNDAARVCRSLARE